MSIVYNTDKRSGITYAYESKSYWDKEKSSHVQKGRLMEGNALWAGCLVKQEHGGKARWARIAPAAQASAASLTKRSGMV